MREAFEAVAEFLARHGGLDEYDAVLQSMQHMGWTLDKDHPAQWRALFAVLRAELSDSGHSVSYVFLFERLLQLYVRIPEAMCRDIFSSKLVLHVIVERLAAAFADFDAEVFRAERDILCHAENIYSTCELIQKKLFRGDESTPLGAFLREFRDLFDDADPKVAWEALHARHLLPDVVFRRDMKRMLSSLEEGVFGKTQIEEMFAASQDTRLTDKRVIIPRRILESRFSGTSSEWRDLADVVSVRGLSAEPPLEDRRESLSGARVQQRMNEVVGETPPGLEHEERVWSARLPIATPGESDSSSEEAETAIDAVVRQENTTQRSPGRAKKKPQQNRQRTPSSTTQRTAHQSPVRQRAQINRPRQRASVPSRARAEVEEIEDDGQGDDDGCLDPAREFPTPKKKRRGRKFWSDAEVDALVQGVKRYGGHWKLIKQAYSEALRDRSNVDIKDKYRNLVNSKRIPPIQQDDHR